MNYIENTYVCLAAPLLLAILCMKREGRRALAFVLSGMTACLLSAYVSAFAANAVAANLTDAAHEISPAVEEIIKSLPLLFYLLVFEPKKRAVLNGAMLIAVGFATFENVCFLTTYGSADLLTLVIRGFGTGAMHVVCGMVVAIGFFFLWDHSWLQMVGAMALLCFVITFHAIFNIFVSQSGPIFWIGSAFPLTMVLAFLVCFRNKIVLK